MSEARMAFENQYDSDYLGRDDAGYYKWMSTQEEWELWDSAWQAARAGQAASEPVAEVAQVGGSPVVFWDKSLLVGTKLYTHTASGGKQAVYSLVGHFYNRPSEGRIGIEWCCDSLDDGQELYAKQEQGHE